MQFKLAASQIGWQTTATAPCLAPTPRKVTHSPRRRGQICFAQQDDRPSTRDVDSLAPKSSRPQADQTRRDRESSLYSDAWAGDAWRGSKFNILTIIIIVSLLAPVLGLVFAWQTYGVYWG